MLTISTQLELLAGGMGRIVCINLRAASTVARDHPVVVLPVAGVGVNVGGPDDTRGQFLTAAWAAVIKGA